MNSKTFSLSRLNDFDLADFRAIFEQPLKSSKLKILTIAFFISGVFTSLIFAQSRVISPASGTWANRQCLVLDVNDGAECFYSFSGSDPLTSGFAYDGPVLIDSAGEITLKIAVVFGDECRERFEVSYVVAESNPFAQKSAENEFLRNTVAKGIFMYSYGNPLSIPASLTYAFGDDEKKIFFPGKELFLNPENRLSRYIPCTVSDGSRFWRFIVLTSGGDIGILAKYTVPFEIRDWTTFVFTGEKLIWAIDDGYWSASTLPVELDRTVRHKISWQSVAYEAGNPIQSFVLPPEPDFVSEEEKNGAVSFLIEGDTRYKMGIVSSGVQGEAFTSGGLLSHAVFDTFEGDSISGTAEFAFFCDGVFMGTKTASYSVDKCPPDAPIFVSNVKTPYSRVPVEIQLESEPGAEIFYAVSDAFEVDEYSVVDSDDFDFVEAGNFALYDVPVILKSEIKSAMFYKVRAYAVDSSGNMSSVSEYRVIIDEYNYYVSADAEVEDADGTRLRPFSSFEQILDVIKQSRFAHFFVSGTIKIPSGETVLSSNCAFSSPDGSGRFVIPSDGSFVVRSSSVDSKNIIFEKERSRSHAKLSSLSSSNSVFFTLENAAVSFENCEILGFFAESGTVFNSMNSVVEMSNSGLTVQSDSYACALSSSDSKISVMNSRISSVSATAVNFSIQGGQFELKESECRVVSHLGRIAELMRTTASLSSNLYAGEFDKKLVGVVPVWTDKETLLLVDSKNVSEGF